MKWSVQPDGRLVPITLQEMIEDGGIIRDDAVAILDYAIVACSRAREVVAQARRVRYVSQLTRRAASGLRRIH